MKTTISHCFIVIFLLLIFSGIEAQSFIYRNYYGYPLGRHLKTMVNDVSNYRNSVPTFGRDIQNARVEYFSSIKEKSSNIDEKEEHFQKLLLTKDLLIYEQYVIGKSMRKGTNYSE